MPSDVPSSVTLAASATLPGLSGLPNSVTPVTASYGKPGIGLPSSAESSSLLSYGTVAGFDNQDPGASKSTHLTHPPQAPSKPLSSEIQGVGGLSSVTDCRVENGVDSTTGSLVAL